MSEYRLNSSKKLDYLNSTFCLKSPFLDKIKQITEEEGVSRMQISAHEARLLQFLVHAFQPQRVIELGTLYAYSSYHLAHALPEGAKLWTLDHNLSRHQTAQKILKESPVIHKIEWLTGPAKESLKSLESQAPFDMIFIDADKISYGDYLSWAEKNLRKGGLLVADNTFLWGAVYEGATENSKSDTQTVEVMKKFNQRLADSSVWKGALIPTLEGLTVGIKL